MVAAHGRRHALGLRVSGPTSHFCWESLPFVVGAPPGHVSYAGHARDRWPMLPQEKQTLSRLRQDTAEWPHLRHSWHWASKAPVEWAVRATPLWAVGGSWAGGEIGGRRVGISIKGVGRWDGWDQGLLDGLGCWGTARWLFQVLLGDCWGCLVPVGGAAEIGPVGAMRGLLGGIWG